MSRVGKRPIELPAGVTVSYEDGLFTVSGPKGTLKREVNKDLEYKIQDNTILVENNHPAKNKQMNAFHGLYRQLIANMVEGVVKGFEKKLKIAGVGYKIVLKGNDAATLNIGFSHPVEIKAVEGITLEADKNTLTVKGIDKELVGQFASYVRGIKPVEPYHGYGIAYADEKIIRKESKASK